MQRIQIENPTSEQRAFAVLCEDMSRRLKASPAGMCPGDMTLNLLRACHSQSCGKCTPCRVGLGRLAEIINGILEGKRDASSIESALGLAKSIKDSADCAIGYQAADLVIKSISAFEKDYRSHAEDGLCVCGMSHAVPCVMSCPAHVDIPGYIALIKEGRNEDAVRLIRKDNPFPAVCGYVCEHPCESSCRRGMVDAPVNICGLKRFAVDNSSYEKKPALAEPTGKTVAVVGGGPGGLTAAYFLTIMGHKVTVFEQRDKLGGMLRYGIPDYRLPQNVLDRDIEYIVSLGVDVVLNTSIGNDITLDELKGRFDAVYVSIGAHDDKKLGIEGEGAEGVISAVQMLRSAGEGNPPDMEGKRVVVIGGGNVAMDATRTALRLGASKVTCAYRRRIADMTALPEEVEDAQAEGAHMLTLAAPDRIETDENGKVAALWVQPQIISAIGSDGRTGVRKANKEPVRVPCDIVVVAIGQSIHTAELEPDGINTRRGVIIAEGSSFVPGSGNVFAGGDAVSGPATVIRAIAAGKVAAANIDDFFGYEHQISVDIDIPEAPIANTPPCGRVELALSNIDDIKGNFNIVLDGMSEEECVQECTRCLRCDKFGYGIFRGGRSFKW